MKIDLSCYIPCSFQEAVELVKTPRLLQQVAAPLVSFTPIDPACFPMTWTERTYAVRLRLGGFHPFGHQNIVISFPETECGFSLRDNGHSYLIRKWDHTITISQTPNGVLYRDTIAISAGLLTPFVWLFVYVFYRHRQWRHLSASHFVNRSRKSTSVNDANS